MFPLISPWLRSLQTTKATGDSPSHHHLAFVQGATHSQQFTQRVVQRYFSEDALAVQRASASEARNVNLRQTLPSAIPAAPGALREPALFSAHADEPDKLLEAAHSDIESGQKSPMPAAMADLLEAAANKPGGSEQGQSLNTLQQTQAETSMPQVIAAATQPPEGVAESGATQAPRSPAQLSAALRETIRRTQASSSVALPNKAETTKLAEQTNSPGQASESLVASALHPEQPSGNHSPAPRLITETPSTAMTASDVAQAATESSGHSMVGEIERRIQRAAEKRLQADNPSISQGSATLKDDLHAAAASASEATSTESPVNSVVGEIERRIQRAAEQRLQASDLAAEASPGQDKTSLRASADQTSARMSRQQEATQKSSAPNATPAVEQTKVHKQRNAKIYSRVEEIKRLNVSPASNATQSLMPSEHNEGAAALETQGADKEVSPNEHARPAPDGMQHKLFVDGERTEEVIMKAETQPAQHEVASSNSSNDVVAGSELQQTQIPAAQNLLDLAVIHPAAYDAASAQSDMGEKKSLLEYADKNELAIGPDIPDLFQPSVGQINDRSANSEGSQPINRLVQPKALGDLAVPSISTVASGPDLPLSGSGPEAIPNKTLLQNVHQQTEAALSPTVEGNAEGNIELHEPQTSQAMMPDPIQPPSGPEIQAAQPTVTMLAQTPTRVGASLKSPDVQRQLDLTNTVSASDPSEREPKYEETLASQLSEPPMALLPSVQRAQQVEPGERVARFFEFDHPSQSASEDLSFEQRGAQREHESDSLVMFTENPTAEAPIHKAASSIETKIQRALVDRTLPGVAALAERPLQRIERQLIHEHPALPNIIDLATRPFKANGSKQKQTAPDLDALARQVAPLVKRLIAVEREREPFSF